MRYIELQRIGLYLSGLLLMAAVADSPKEAEPTAVLTVVVSGIRSNQGKVHFALYNSKEGFTKNPAEGGKSAIHDHCAEWQFKKLVPGEYAVAIFHDENNDGKFNMNFLGIPTEDYGFSNGARAGLGPPAWKKVVFAVHAGTNEHRIKIHDR